MTVYDITANTTNSTGAGLDMLGGDTLKIDAGVTLSSTDPLGADGALSTGGNNIIKIYGTLTGTSNAFGGLSGNDVFHVYSTGQVLGGTGAAIGVGGGTNTLTNAGTISTTNVNANYAIFFTGGNNIITNSNAGTISEASNNGLAIREVGGTNTLTNHGQITSTGSGGAAEIADFIGGANILTNTGTMSGAGYGVNFEGGANKVTNAGVMSAAHYTIQMQGPTNDIYNSGTITTSGFAAIWVASGGNLLINYATGTISAPNKTAVYFADGTDTIDNDGSITSGSGYSALYIDAALGVGNNSIVNNGTIQTSGGGGGWAVYTAGSGNSLINSGTISSSTTSGGAIHMGGNSIITNTSTGAVTYVASFNPGIDLHDGNNTVSNSGNIDSFVLLGTNAQSDSFLGATGTFTGAIVGGNGNDTIEVGSGHNVIVGGLGGDFLQGGSGHTLFNYNSVSESNSTGSSYGMNMDTVDGFNAWFGGGRDKFEFVSGSGTMTFGTHIAWDGQASGVLNMASFATDLVSAIGTTLAANGAVLVHASPGTSLAGDYFLVVDGNATIGFQSGSDYVVELTNMTAPSHLHQDIFWSH